MPTKTSKNLNQKTSSKTTAPAIPTTPPALSSALPHHSHWRGEWLWLVVPALIASIGWWGGLWRLLEPGLRSGGLGSSLWLTASTMVAFMFTAGLALILPNIVHYRWVYPAFGILLSLPSFFYFGLTAATALAALIVATGLWAAGEAAGRESIMRIRLDVRTTLTHVVPWAVLAASIAVALLQYDSARSTGQAQHQLDSLVDRLVTAVEKVGPKFIDNFQADATVDELISQQIPTADDLIQSVVQGNRLTSDERAELQSRLENLGASTSAVPAAGASLETVRQALNRELQTARGQIIDELRTAVGKQLGVKLNGTQTVHQALVQVVTERTGAKSVRVAQWLPPIIALGLFFALRLLSPLFVIGGVAAGWFWYRALRLAHVIKVVKVPALAERLRWGGN